MPEAEFGTKVQRSHIKGRHNQHGLRTATHMGEGCNIRAAVGCTGIAGGRNGLPVVVATNILLPCASGEAVFKVFGEIIRSGNHLKRTLRAETAHIGQEAVLVGTISTNPCIIISAAHQTREGEWTAGDRQAVRCCGNVVSSTPENGIATCVVGVNK